MLFNQSPEEKLYKMICNYYDKKGISYQRDDEERLTLMINNDRETAVNFFVSADTKPLSLRIVSRLPFNVPKKSRDMMIMALQAINQRLPVGKFQMYVSDGTVDYRVILPLVGIQYDEEWLENVLNETFSIVTGRDEKILSLLRGEITFEEFDRCVR